MIDREGPKKRANDRKSYGSAEAWRKQKKARNAARGTQVWVGGKIIEGGHWTRMIAEP
jgi:hypothetical protein